MSGKVYAVIGANRGIGLGLVTRLAATVGNDSVIVATTRQPAQATELEALRASSSSRLDIVKVDVTLEEDCRALAAALSSTKLQIGQVWINAGIHGGHVPLADLTATKLAEVYAANAIGPHSVIRALFSQLKSSPGAKVVIVTSSVSSLTKAHDFNERCRQLMPDFCINGSYTSSKTALNMLCRQWAEELEPHGVTVFNVHPGTVATDFAAEAGAKAESCISVEESVNSMLDVVNKADVGKEREGILSYNGSVIPW